LLVERRVWFLKLAEFLTDLSNLLSQLENKVVLESFLKMLLSLDDFSSHDKVQTTLEVFSF